MASRYLTSLRTATPTATTDLLCSVSANLLAYEVPKTEGKSEELE